MSDVFEKSLDEIIGEKKSTRGPRGPRRERGGERGERRERSPRRDRSPRCGSSDRTRRDHRDRSRDRRPRRDDIFAERPGESLRARAHRLMSGRYYIKITDLHYSITDKELELLLTKIGPLTFHFIDFDRSGRSSGVAYAQFRKLEDNNAAVQSFDGKKAAGQIIHVEVIKPLWVNTRPREREERSEERVVGNGGRRRGKPTAEDLDNDLSNYMSGDVDVDVDVDAPQPEKHERAPHHKKTRPTADDLDKELEAYMGQPDQSEKPFAAVE